MAAKYQVPEARLPMVALATAATVIASQALISGAFTLAEQAINLNLWPRMSVVHTSSKQRGQVFVLAESAEEDWTAVIVPVLQRARH